MQKVLIMGCSGAGKSTFARKLHTLTHLELIHLDEAYWKPNWVAPSKTEWNTKVQELLARPNWIMDGNFGGTKDQRIAAADTVILFDLPTWKCLWRVLKRTVRYWGKTRPDMHEGCPERLDIGFLWYITTFKSAKRPSILARIEVVRNEKNVIIFKNDTEVAQFLRAVSQGRSL